MNLSKENQQVLDSAKQAWITGAHHSGLMSLGWAYRKAGATQAEAIADAQALYTSIEDAKKHDSHMKEVEDAFSKVYDTDYQATKTAPTPKTENSQNLKQNQLNWLELQSVDTNILKAIKQQDVDTKRIRTREAMEALYRNAQGRIRHGRSLETIRWTDSSENFIGVWGNAHPKDGESKYMTTTMFGGMVDQKKQQELDDLGIKATAYSAQEENILSKALVLLEMDEPIGEEKIEKEAFGYLDKAQKDAYRQKVLEHTCLILERSGLRPTCVTFSGNRSYHCVFRLVKPVTREEWDKFEGRLRSAYSRLGADKAVLIYNGMTRVPRGVSQLQAQAGECQRIMYLDKDAEISLEAYVEALEKVADEIATKTEESSITIAIEKTPDPKTGKDKWEFLPSKWNKSLTDLGICPKYVKLDKSGKYELTLKHDGGLYHVISAQGAIDTIVKAYMAQDYMAGVMFREKRASKLTSEKYEQYAGLATAYNEPTDTRRRIYIPYRNGMVEITENGIEFHAGDYMGFDIQDEIPTLRRDWHFTFEGSEIQDFVELACGRADNDPDWLQRRNAIFSLLGYEICGAKEAVNYFPVIVEKSLDDHNGGTGKSLITKALSYIHKSIMLDFKTWDDDQRFFFAEMAQSLPRVARCEDLGKSFDLEKMFNRLADGFKADIKGKDAVTLSMDLMPKFIATSNSYLRGTGNSYARRYKEYEITDYWRGKDPAKHYGHLLYFDWSEEEWARFDSFMARCALTYLKYGLKEFKGVNSVEKSLDVNLGDLRDFFDEKCATLPLWTTATDLVGEYDEWYKNMHAGRYPKVSYNMKTMKAKAKTYCTLSGLSFNDNDGKTWKYNGESKRWILIDVASNPPTNDDDKNDNVANKIDNVANKNDNVANKNSVEKGDGKGDGDDKKGDVANSFSVTDKNPDDFLSDAPDFYDENSKNDEKNEFPSPNVTAQRHLCVTSESVENEVDTKKVTLVTQDLHLINEKNNLINDQKEYQKLRHQRHSVTTDFSDSNSLTKEEAERRMKEIEENVESRKTTVKLNDGETVEVVIPEPLEKPWWIFNNVKLSFGEILYNGRVIAEVVYCDGKIPEPITNDDGSKYYQISGSRLKAIDTGIIDETDKEYRPVVFVVLEKEAE